MPVGTLHCIAPEMMASCYSFSCSSKGEAKGSAGLVKYDCAVDWWGLGTLVFEMIFGCIPDWNRSQPMLSPIAREQLCKEFSTATGLPADVADLSDINEYRWAADPAQQLLAWFAITAFPERKEESIDSAAIVVPTAFSTNDLDAEIKEAIFATWGCAPLFTLHIRDPSVDDGSDCNLDHLTAEMRMQRKLVDMEQHELWEAKSFIEDLLCIHPVHRLNGSSPEKVRSHLFFHSAVPGARRVDWAAIEMGVAAPGDVDFDRRLGFVESLESVLSVRVSDDDLDDMIQFRADTTTSSSSGPLLNDRANKESNACGDEDSLTDEQQQLFSAF